MLAGARFGARVGKRALGLLQAALALVSIPATATSQARARAPIASVSCSAGRAGAIPPSIRWRGTDVRWGEWPIRLGDGRGVASRIIVVVLDPRRVTLTLDLARRESELLPWNVAVAPADARVALNAGQFTDDGPWGWVVHRSREWQAPGSGTLAGAFVIDTGGAAHVVHAREIDAFRRSATVREAVQSYPSLLADGHPLPELCDSTASLDHAHRDTRLAIGVRANGEVVIAMSRYDGGTLPARTPIGPTTPEMAEVMRRLGAHSAIMLDGGLSAQLLVRESAGDVPRAWPGLRNVPLALVGR